MGHMMTLIPWRCRRVAGSYPEGEGFGSSNTGAEGGPGIHPHPSDGWACSLVAWLEYRTRVAAPGV